MAFDIDDGYTLDGETLPEFGNDRGLPVVQFRYRPAMAAAQSAYLAKLRKLDRPEDEFEASARIICDHLVSWDVLQKGRPAPITPESLSKLPFSVVGQLLTAVLSWPEREQEEAAKNSSTG